MNSGNRSCIALIALLFSLLTLTSAGAQTIVIGSKKFPESNVLGKIAKRTLEKAGFKVEHKEDLGSTGIVWGALKGGSIAVYPEYTATISQEILKVKGEMTPEALRDALKREGIGLGGDLGFNDNYGLVMQKSRAEALHIRKISDLTAHPELKVAVSHEFLGRQDGWQPLATKYGLAIKSVSGIDHALGYIALNKGEIDLTEAYTTDAEIAEYKLIALEDDRSYFPKYHAVFVYQARPAAEGHRRPEDAGRHDFRRQDDRDERGGEEDQGLRTGGFALFLGRVRGIGGGRA